MSNSKKNLQSAVSDIALIRQTMEGAGVHLDKLSSLLILYGIGSTIIIAASSILMLVVAKTRDVQTGVRISAIIGRVNFLFLLALFIFFIKKRGEIKKSDGGYPLRLFELWGVILFIVPAVNRIIRFVMFSVIPHFRPDYSAITLSQIVSNTLNSTMLTVALMFTGLMLGRKWLIWTGAGVLTIYPLLFITISRSLTGRADIDIAAGYYTERGLLVSFIIPLICLAAGIYFRRIGHRIEKEPV